MSRACPSGKSAHKTTVCLGPKSRRECPKGTVPTLSCAKPKGERGRSYKAEEVKRLRHAILEIEKNELDQYVLKMKNAFKQNVSDLRTGKTNAMSSYKYLLVATTLDMDLPAFVQYATSKMVDKSYIEEFADPNKRYEDILKRTEHKRVGKRLPTKLSVLRGALRHHDRRYLPEFRPVSLEA